MQPLTRGNSEASFIPMVIRDTTSSKKSPGVDAGLTSGESLWKPSRRVKGQMRKVPVQ